ncbi:MAG TPA: hypothetical protein VGL22_06685 [Terracidiphilus sp.]
MSWLLLLLVTASVVVAPLTQHLWTWDGFLHGGQDFETATYLIFVFFCLAIVLARVCKACLEQLFAALRAWVLSRIRGPRPASRIIALKPLFCTAAAPCGAAFLLPLRI